MLQDKATIAHRRIRMTLDTTGADIATRTHALRSRVARARRRAAARREMQRLTPWLKADLGLE